MRGSRGKARRAEQSMHTAQAARAFMHSEARRSASRGSGALPPRLGLWASTEMGTIRVKRRADAKHSQSQAAPFQAQGRRLNAKAGNAECGSAVRSAERLTACRTVLWRFRPLDGNAPSFCPTRTSPRAHRAHLAWTHHETTAVTSCASRRRTCTIRANGGLGAAARFGQPGSFTV